MDHIDRPSSATSNTTDSAHVRHGGGDAGDRAQRTFEQLADDTRRQTARSAAKQKRAVAEQIRGLASALRHTADRLKQQKQAPLSRYTDRIASDMERMSDFVRDKNFNSLLDSTQDFARRRPAVFLGGAVATGFLLTRFLKSSANQDQHSLSAEASAHSPSAGPASRHESPSEERSANGHSSDTTENTSTIDEVEHHEQ